MYLLITAHIIHYVQGMHIFINYPAHFCFLLVLSYIYTYILYIANIYISICMLYVSLNCLCVYHPVIYLIQLKINIILQKTIGTKYVLFFCCKKSTKSVYRNNRFNNANPHVKWP